MELLQAEELEAIYEVELHRRCLQVFHELEKENGTGRDKQEKDNEGLGLS